MKDWPVDKTVRKMRWHMGKMDLIMKQDFGKLDFEEINYLLYMFDPMLTHMNQLAIDMKDWAHEMEEQLDTHGPHHLR